MRYIGYGMFYQKITPCFWIVRMDTKATEIIPAVGLGYVIRLVDGEDSVDGDLKHRNILVVSGSSATWGGKVVFLEFDTQQLIGLA